MSSPLISVVLPVYNGGPYVASALQSLLRQDQDLEVIVSDDCSTDDSAQIVRSFDSPAIRLLTNARNGGQFVNFNRGLALARGSYIQFFSHDDIAHPGFLRAQVASFAQDDRIGLVYGSCNIIDESGRVTYVCNDAGTPDVIDFQTYLDISSQHGSLPPSISSVMVKRAVLDIVGGFDTRYAVVGDLEFFNRVAESFFFARNRSLLLDVRVHSGSVTLNSASQLRCMREEVDILPYYRRNLGDEKYKDMMARRTRERGAAHAKYLMRLLGSLHWQQFANGYRELSKVHNVPLCMLFALRHLIGRRG